VYQSMCSFHPSLLPPLDRKLMLVPRGRHVRGHSGKFLSLYLDAPEAAFTPAHMAPRATFSIGLINQLPGQPPLMRGV